MALAFGGGGGGSLAGMSVPAGASMRYTGGGGLIIRQNRPIDWPAQQDAPADPGNRDVAVSTYGKTISLSVGQRRLGGNVIFSTRLISRRIGDRTYTETIKVPTPSLRVSEGTNGNGNANNPNPGPPPEPNPEPNTPPPPPPAPCCDSDRPKDDPAATTPPRTPEGEGANGCTPGKTCLKSLSECGSGVGFSVNAGICGCNAHTYCDRGTGTKIVKKSGFPGCC